MYGYVKPKYSGRTNLCYMNSNRFIVHVKTNGIYKVIAEDVENRFDTSNYKLDRLLPKGKTKKVIRITKDKLDEKIMTKFVGLRSKTYNYLIDEGSEDKKAKSTKKCFIKRKLKFENYKNCSEATQLENETNYLKKIKLTQIELKKIIGNS